MTYASHIQQARAGVLLNILISMQIYLSVCIYIHIVYVLIYYIHIVYVLLRAGVLLNILISMHIYTYSIRLFVCLLTCLLICPHMSNTHAQEGYLIHIGQLVSVRSGDTLDKLAARFGTTLRQVFYSVVRVHILW